MKNIWNCGYLLALLLSFTIGSWAQMPNDPFFSEQWGLDNQDYGYHIDILKAWDIEKGNKNIAIVLIGTGVDYNHPDLKKNMWVNPNEIPGNEIDDDNNGYIDDIHGINAIDATGDPMDDHGHETGMAGIIGAEVNNGIGIAGVMHNVSLIACKFLDRNGAGTLKDALTCLEYVESLAKRSDTGVTIVATNNGWGGSEYNPELYEAIKRQRDLGILFVATAGNEGMNLDKNPSYPMSYDVSNIIVVGKMDTQGNHVDSGCYGANTVALASPGREIKTTWMDGSYEKLSGTFATAFVSGVIGLIKSHDPSLSYSQVKYKLLHSVQPLPVDKDQAYYISGGYLNAFNALQ